MEGGLYELLQILNQTLTVVMVSHDLGFVSSLVKSVICVKCQVASHPTSELTAEIIDSMYGSPMRIVRHNHGDSKEPIIVAQFLTDLQQYQFLQNALLTGILASVACGIIGTYIVVRRISYIADGIAHAVLGGMGGALYLHKVYHLNGIVPLHGALVAAVIAAVIIGFVSLRAKQREDTVISALWAVGMAAGIIFISRTPGYNEDLMGYLFGNILMVSSTDLWMLAGLDTAIILVGLLFITSSWQSVLTRNLHE